MRLFSLTKGEQGFMTASAMVGATIGSLAAAKPGDWYGRRDSLKEGGASVLGPISVAEIAPASWRGRLVACFQVNS